MERTPGMRRERMNAVVMVEAADLNRDGRLDPGGPRRTGFLSEHGTAQRIVFGSRGSAGEADALSGRQRRKVNEMVIGVSGRRREGTDDGAQGVADASARSWVDLTAATAGVSHAD